MKIHFFLGLLKLGNKMGTGTSSNVQTPSYIVCSVIMIGLIDCVFGINQNLGDALKILKGQMNALPERRQEAFIILEEAIKNSWNENSEVAFVKSKLQKLRNDVQKLKRSEGPSLNKQKNDHLILQWLSLTVNELRTQLSEILTANNASFEIQQRQELVSSLNLLRGDVASFRQDLEEIKARQKQTVLNFAQLKQDVENYRSRKQNTTDTKLEMDEIRKEMAFFTKLLYKFKKNIGLLKISLFQEIKQFVGSSYHLRSSSNQSFANNKNYRHNRLFRVGNTTTSIFQDPLNETLDHFKKHLMSFSSLNIENFQDCNETYEKLFERVKKLEEADKYTFKQMFNLSKHTSELDSLHLSILQLLETVESLETKVDKYIPNFQKELSKMEFNLDQTTGSFSTIKHDYEHQKSFLKTLAKNLERLEKRLENNHSDFIFLHTQIANISRLLHGRVNNAVDINGEEIQGSRLLALEAKQKLSNLQNQSNLPTTTFVTGFNGTDGFRNKNSFSELTKSPGVVQKEYNAIIKQLPRDCGAISENNNGLYVIAPENGPQLLVSCDMLSSPGGWTVVQRRIDGSEEFNRKWNEYAAGFGTPSGEFWLGNEALHRLTLKNCSSLRIDLTDIYGKKWIAEYNEFYISNATDGYRIHVSGYTGNASDALEYQNKMQFSTIDSDRDISGTHCAQNYEGGWWFSHCQHVNLNGRYNLGLTWFDNNRNEWIVVAFSEMKVRRRAKCVQ